AVDLAVKSLKQGAADFIVKPWQNEQLLSTLQGLMDEHKPVQANVKSKPLVSDRGIVGKSAIMNDLFYKLDKVSPTEANILILGENGTGKDLIANAIHQ